MITDQVTTAEHAAAHTAPYARGPVPGAGSEPPPDRTALARSGTRRSAGGRWLVWCLRGVVWAILLLIGYRGVAAIVTGSPAPGFGAAGPSGAAGSHPGGRTGAGPAGNVKGRTSAGHVHGSKASTARPRVRQVSGANHGFPVALAQAFALDFGQVYLSFSPAAAGQRAAALAPFVLPGAGSQFGWNGTGTQTLDSEQAIATRVVSAHVAIVTLLAEVNGKLEELAVPLYAAGGGMVVTAKPALVSPPLRVVPPGAATPAPGDRVAQASLTRQLPAFFRAFAARGVVRTPSLVAARDGIGGLNGVVTFGGIASVSVPATGGTTRNITVTVIWRTPGEIRARTSTAANAPADIAMTYAMTVLHRAGNWYVVSIGASAEMGGPAS